MACLKGRSFLRRDGTSAEQRVFVRGVNVLPVFDLSVEKEPIGERFVTSSDRCRHDRQLMQRAPSCPATEREPMGEHHEDLGRGHDGACQLPDQNMNAIGLRRNRAEAIRVVEPFAEFFDECDHFLKLVERIAVDDSDFAPGVTCATTASSKHLALPFTQHLYQGISLSLGGLVSDTR